MKLGPADKTCGDCANLYAHSRGRTYWKCKLMKTTFSLMTDVRLKWRSCEKFEEKR
jgi:hypothetical protein